MQITQTVVALLAAASAAIAAPVEEVGTVSMAAKVPDWTIKNMKRVCNAADTKCTWTFGIDNHSSGVKNCNYVVSGAKASTKNGGPTKCGPFTVTSGWSNQFGDGFTTLSVANFNTKRIVYPAYTDAELKAGKVVKPDRSYPVNNF